METKRNLFTRRNILGVLATGAAGSLAHAFWIEPDQLSITRQDVDCKTLPPDLDGLRIGLLSDFHFRPDHDAELVDKVLDRVRQEKLDLVALTGDYMSDDPHVVVPLLARLKNLTAAHGVFAVMGNHDGWAGNGSVIKRQFEKAGISFLVNHHSLLTIRGESLAVAGTDFVWKGQPDPAKAFRGIPRTTPVIALVHEPDYFDTVAAYRDITLQLSGHSHGGQCRVPVINYAPRTVRYGKKYLEGLFSRGDSNLFVTRGVGTGGPRVRFSCPPELAILTLRSSALA